MCYSSAEYQPTERTFKLFNNLDVHQRSVYLVPVALESVSMPVSPVWLLIQAQPCLGPFSAEAQRQTRHIRHGLHMPWSEQGVMLVALPDMSDMLVPGRAVSHVHVSVLFPVPEHCQVSISQSAASPGLIFMGFKFVFSTFHSCIETRKLWALLGE